MTMTPFLRKFGLTAHITFSVSWLGAVAGFLTLAIAGLTSRDAQTVRAAYLCMELIGWGIIVPFCLNSLLTGVIQSLGTPWGLLRHYWVVVKLLLTLASTVILFLHMQPISYLADLAAQTTFTDSEYRGLRIQLIADAGAALLVLLGTTTLSVYKPWGRTPYGMRQQQDQSFRISVGKSLAKKPWVLNMLLGLMGLVILLFILLHLIDGDFGRH